MIIKHDSPTKKQRLKERRAQQLEAGFYYQGDTFQIDDRSRAAIAGRALRLMLGPAIATVEWRTQDNRMVLFSSDEFLAFAQAVDAHIESLYQASWSQKDAIT